MEARPKKLKSAVFLIVLTFAILALGLYNKCRYHIEKQTRFMMDTYVTITVVCPGQTASKAIDAAFNRMRQIDEKFNPLNPKSPVYAFNHHNIALTDPEILKLIKIALEEGQSSKGAFDITVAPLLELWGFYSKEYRLPKGEEISTCLKNVGQNHLLLKDGKLKKDSTGVNIDLGGIAKGYAVAQALKVLKQHGLSNALIDAGGDVYAMGKKGRTLWRIGIKSPRARGLLGFVEAEDSAVMGSGDYERFFIKDGKRYHHIFNPKTGYPCEGVTSVTIIYPDPVRGQVYAKLPFFLGPEKGLEALEKIPGLEALIVTSSQEKLYSPGLKQKIHFMEEQDDQRQKDSYN